MAGMAAAVSIKSAETSANAGHTGIETGRSTRVTARKAATPATALGHHAALRATAP